VTQADIRAILPHVAACKLETFETALSVSFHFALLPLAKSALKWHPPKDKDGRLNLAWSFEPNWH
jgi:hypothetical protein